jgi:hypothetical protein
MEMCLVRVYDRSDEEENVGSYYAVSPPRHGELVAIGNRMLRVEEVYWMVMPVHDQWSPGPPAPLAMVTVFGRQTTGPHEE